MIVRAIDTFLDGRQHIVETLNFSDLSSTVNHSDDFSGVRAENIEIRLRLVALSFGLMALLWIPVDYHTLDSSLFIPIMWMRITISAAMILLGLWSNRAPSITLSHIHLALLVTFPLLFYVVSQQLLNGAIIESSLTIGYTFLPYLMVVMLAIFPLTMTEGATYTALIALFTIVPHLLNGELISIGSLADLWLLGLLAGICMWPGIAQLHMLLTLYRQATRDPLTTLMNRRLLIKQLTTEITASSHARPLSILLLDLDRFKRINDTYGHLTGDQVLVDFSRLLKENLRPSDTAGRYGGEEFMMILPDTAPEEAMEIAERIRRSCHGRNITLDNSGGRKRERERVPNYTVSIGVAALHENEHARSLIERVDDGLYQAKSGGRDRVVLID